MFDSAILEVILGMVFVFSLLSIFVTQINNIISDVLRLRAKHLRRGIQELITDPTVQAKVFTHPLIRLIRDQLLLPTQVVDEDDAIAIANGQVEKVGWVEPKTFVNVLMSVIRVDSDQQLFGAMLNIVDQMPDGRERRILRVKINNIMRTGEGMQDLQETIGILTQGAYRDALLDAAHDIDEQIGTLGLQTDSVISLTAGVRNIRDPYLQSALEAILSTANSVVEAEQQLEDWFNEGMSRVSAAFTSRMQTYSLIIGLLIAIVLNVDTLQVARTLWEDPALRIAVAVAAENTDLGNVLESTTVPATVIPGEAGSDGVVENIQGSVGDAQQTIAQILDLRLPITWYYEDLSELDPSISTNEYRFQDARNLWNMVAIGVNPNTLSLLFGKVVGIILTTIAIAQGAPFWFNILNRLKGGRE